MDKLNFFKYSNIYTPYNPDVPPPSVTRSAIVCKPLLAAPSRVESSRVIAFRGSRRRNSIVTRPPRPGIGWTAGRNEDFRKFKRNVIPFARSPLLARSRPYREYPENATVSVARQRARAPAIFYYRNIARFFSFSLNSSQFQ